MTLIQEAETITNGIINAVKGNQKYNHMTREKLVEMDIVSNDHSDQPTAGHASGLHPAPGSTTPRDLQVHFSKIHYSSDLIKDKKAKTCDVASDGKFQAAPLPCVQSEVQSHKLDVVFLCLLSIVASGGVLTGWLLGAISKAYM